MRPGDPTLRLGPGTPPIGFGCCPMGGHGWGVVEEGELIAAVREALELGIQLFDTADIYGLGASETTLGKALAGRRDAVLIATKFGVRQMNGQTFHDTSPAWIRRAVEGSLQRLAVDCIDLYQMHYWDGKTSLDDIVAVLNELQFAGKIRAYGVTNFDPRCAAFAGAAHGPVSFSYQYSLVDRAHEAEILAIQSAGEMMFLSWGSLGQGVLSGKYSSRDSLHQSDRRRREVYANFHGERFAALQRVIAEMRTLGAELGVPSLSQLALRWVIDRVPRALPLVGIKRPEQIHDAAGVLNFKLNAEVFTRLDALTTDLQLSSTTSASSNVQHH